MSAIARVTAFMGARSPARCPVGTRVLPPVLGNSNVRRRRERHHGLRDGMLPEVGKSAPGRTVASDALRLAVRYYPLQQDVGSTVSRR